jgi:hypothetical protein
MRYYNILFRLLGVAWLWLVAGGVYAQPTLRDLKKTERFVRRSIRQQMPYDSIVANLERRACVAAAAWDKCAMKILPYPSYSTIGVRYVSPLGEYGYIIQEGTMGRVRILGGWSVRLAPPRNRCVYKRRTTCAGFVETQKNLCTRK